MEKSILRKDRSIVEMTNRITKTQRIAYNMMLDAVFFELREKHIFEMDIETFTKKMGMDHKPSYAYIKELIQGLKRANMEYLIFDPEGKEIEWSETNLFSAVTISNGIIRWEYSHFLKKKLESPQVYARLNLEISKRFISKHALALWEWFCMKKEFLEQGQINVSTGEVPLENIKKLLGLDGKYPKWIEFNRTVITPAIKEINEFSEFKVNVEQIKKHRKVLALKFILNLKKSQQLEMNLENETLLQTLIRIGVAERSAQQFFEKFTEEELKIALKYYQNYKSPIDDINKFLNKCLTDQWGLTHKEWFAKKSEGERKNFYADFQKITGVDPNKHQKEFWKYVGKKRSLPAIQSEFF